MSRIVVRSKRCMLAAEFSLVLCTPAIVYVLRSQGRRWRWGIMRQVWVWSCGVVGARRGLLSVTRMVMMMVVVVVMGVCHGWCRWQWRRIERRRTGKASLGYGAPPISGAGGLMLVVRVVDHGETARVQGLDG